MSIKHIYEHPQALVDDELFNQPDAVINEYMPLAPEGMVIYTAGYKR